jgi:cytidylate kinase
MDGRDIGTVVLPQATIKIYLTAAPEERARRRWLQQQKKGITESYEDVLAAVIKRDYDDSHRAAAPLRQAEDAWLCDSTHLDFEGTVQAILAYIRQRIGEVPCR